MRFEGLPTLGLLPQKNVRRDNRGDILDYFKKTAIIDLVIERYDIDLKRFYGAYNVDQLLCGNQLEQQPPLQRGLAKAKQQFNSTTNTPSESLNA